MKKLRKINCLCMDRNLLNSDDETLSGEINEEKYEEEEKEEEEMIL